MSNFYSNVEIHLDDHIIHPKIIWVTPVKNISIYIWTILDIDDIMWTYLVTFTSGRNMKHLSYDDENDKYIYTVKQAEIN